LAKLVDLGTGYLRFQVVFSYSPVGVSIELAMYLVSAVPFSCPFWYTESCVDEQWTADLTEFEFHFIKPFFIVAKILFNRANFLIGRFKFLIKDEDRVE
jgi:hypothetical protein